MYLAKEYFPALIRQARQLHEIIFGQPLSALS